LRLTIGVVRVRRKTKSKSRGVSFAAPSIELYQPRGTPQQQHKYTSGQRIERPKVPDLPKTGKVAHRVHNVVRCLALWLVNYQGAVEWRRLRLFWHGISV
jgi:hypothetical protein